MSDKVWGEYREHFKISRGQKEMGVQYSSLLAGTKSGTCLAKKTSNLFPIYKSLKEIE